jgi:hypothetical protein
MQRTIDAPRFSTTLAMLSRRFLISGMKSSMILYKSRSEGRRKEETSETACFARRRRCLITSQNTEFESIRQHRKQIHQVLRNSLNDNTFPHNSR